MQEIVKLVRDNIRNLTPYSSARDEFSSADMQGMTLLDANENSLGLNLTGRDYTRYPDPRQRTLKAKISELKGIRTEQIFLGNGSDEPIDLLMRAFCEPGTDSVLITPPTYGMYEVSANINAVAVKNAPLTKAFELDVPRILESCDSNTKIIFLCSPNNPTGNCLSQDSVRKVIEGAPGLVVVDEAYIDFIAEQSLLNCLGDYPNLVVLQTFSKGWGLAGIRLGMAFAAEPIVEVLSRIKFPYNINLVTQELALKALDKIKDKEAACKIIVDQREILSTELGKLSCVRQVFRSNANFLLVRFDDPGQVYRALLSQNIVVRDRARVPLCEGCLRITVGSPEQNKKILKVLREM